MVTAIEIFIDKYKKHILEQNEHHVQKIDAKMVYESSSQMAESAGSLDGCRPKELSLFSKTICEKVAIMLNQIEEGAPWSRSSMHARVVYLEKEGAGVGEAMSYRPLTITAPLYRCWATLRLASLED